MKKQQDLILIVPDKYNDYFSILHSKKTIPNKATPKSNTISEINPPFSTDYETINIEANSDTKRINIKKTFSIKKSPLPIISKHGLLFNTNRLLTLNKKSLEGFKPIEDNKIRNKFKLKNIKNPLSIKYLSLKEKKDKFDINTISIFKKDKFGNFNISNQRYATNINNEEFFNKNEHLNQKLNILNKYLNKTYERHKKQFKKYYEDNKDYLKELLTIEILNETSRLKFMDDKTINNSNRLYTSFSPNPRKISLKSSIINNNIISHEIINDLKKTNIKKCSACYRKKILEENNNILNEEKENENLNIKEEEKELIIHNVFFEWVMDNVIMKINNCKLFNYSYNLFNKNLLLSAQKSIKHILNKEIKTLSNYLFKNSSNLNNSYDSLINSLRPQSSYIIKLRNKSKKINEKTEKKLKSANSSKTNYYNIDELFNSINTNNNVKNNDNEKDNDDIKQKILSKLIEKINNSNIKDNLDIKNLSHKKLKNIGMVISAKKKFMNENDLSNSIKNTYISNRIDNSKDMSLLSKTPRDIKIEEHLKGGLNKYKSPKMKRKDYIKLFISKYYSKNYQNFFKKLNKINSNDNDNNSFGLTEKTEDSFNNKKILPLISNDNNKRILHNLRNQIKLKDYNLFNKDGLNNDNNNKSNEKDKNKVINRNEHRHLFNIVLISNPESICSKREEIIISEQSRINTDFPKVNSNSINKNKISSYSLRDKQKEKKLYENIIRNNNKIESPKSNSIEKINKDKIKINEIIKRNNLKNADIKIYLNNVKNINYEINKDKSIDKNENYYMNKNEIKEMQKESSSSKINELKKIIEYNKKIEMDEDEGDLKKIDEKNIEKEIDKDKYNNNIKERHKEIYKKISLSSSKKEIKEIKKINDLKEKENKKEEKILNKLENDIKKEKEAKNKVNEKGKPKVKEKEHQKEENKTNKKDIIKNEKIEKKSEEKKEEKKKEKNKETKRIKKEEKHEEKKEEKKEEKYEENYEEKYEENNEENNEENSEENNEENVNEDGGNLIEKEEKEKTKENKKDENIENIMIKSSDINKDNNKDLDLENILSIGKSKTKKKKKNHQKSSQNIKSQNIKSQKDQEDSKPMEPKPEPQIEFIPIKKRKSKQIGNLTLKSPLINLINKQKEKEKEKELENKNKEKKQSLSKSKDDINEEDQQNLLSYAKQLNILKELNNKNKTEDSLQREKEIKERYKDIISKYLYNLKLKELVKKKEKFKNYEKSKIKVQYNNEKEIEDDTETELILKIKEEEKENTEKENTEKELSILLEDEENDSKELNGMVKLIYDNSYLFKHKKKDIQIKQEVLNILNNSKNLENNEKIEENLKYNSENTSYYNIKKTDLNLEYENQIRKLFKKRKMKKNKYKNKNVKNSLFNDDLDKNKKIEKKEEIQNSDEEFEKRLNEFFMKIKNLKNKEDLSDLDALMNEEFRNPEIDKKLNSKRLNDFIENRGNFRNYDRNLKPRFNFLSPIKFSVKDLSH